MNTVQYQPPAGADVLCGEVKGAAWILSRWEDRLEAHAKAMAQGGESPMEPQDWREFAGEMALVADRCDTLSKLVTR